MKRILVILGGAILVLAGCATSHVSTAVGPNPAGVAVGTGHGQLEVFSALSPRLEGENPTWKQHSDYYVLTSDGRQIEQVMNAPANYSTLPALVSLPAGEYIVKAPANGAVWINVPVVIKPDEITRVHLDGGWQPDVPTAKLVMAPTGYAIGWRAGSR